jgi:ADP-ribose pyrophosphatase YjhB (NUDIX family)
LPVAVVVLPVGDNGVLVIRRDIEPGRGQLALPGGFIDIYESWQEAAARELWEEACIKVDPSQIQEYRVRSNTPPDGYLMVFGLGPRLALEELPPFVPNSETTERLVITEMVPLCFLTHEKVLREYFAGR